MPRIPIIPVDSRRFLTLREAASLFAVSEATIRRLAHAGDLNTIRIEHQMRITRYSLDRYLFENAQRLPAIENAQRLVAN